MRKTNKIKVKINKTKEKMFVVVTADLLYISDYVSICLQIKVEHTVFTYPTSYKEMGKNIFIFRDKIK